MLFDEIFGVVQISSARTDDVRVLLRRLTATVFALERVACMPLNTSRSNYETTVRGARNADREREGTTRGI